MRAYRYYDLLLCGMVTVLLCSNLIGPAKVCEFHFPLIGRFSFGAGNLFFPISYIFGDIMTEVYGYARARRAIWAGFAAMIFATVMTQFVLRMPPQLSDNFVRDLQPALEIVFGGTWRIIAASIIAYWVGDFVNSYVLAKMKLITNGRWLWTRTIGSTICGQFADSILFYPIAFLGVWTDSSLMSVIVFNFVFKVSVEVVFTPVTYWVVGAIKRAENVDVYDRHTHFTPFSLKDEN